MRSFARGFYYISLLAYQKKEPHRQLPTSLVEFIEYVRKQLLLLKTYAQAGEPNWPVCLLYNDIPRPNKQVGITFQSGKVFPISSFNMKNGQRFFLSLLYFFLSLFVYVKLKKELCITHSTISSWYWNQMNSSTLQDMHSLRILRVPLYVVYNVTQTNQNPDNQTYWSTGSI